MEKGMKENPGRNRAGKLTAAVRNTRRQRRCAWRLVMLTVQDQLGGNQRFLFFWLTSKLRL